jgi:hypothetical protein
LTLPADVHFTILKNLHIVQATCLGLTNTKLYAVLKAVHPGKIPVDPYAYSYNWAEIGLLGELISEWMKPRILWGGFVFVTPERYKELEDRDYDLVCGHNLITLVNGKVKWLRRTRGYEDICMLGGRLEVRKGWLVLKAVVDRGHKNSALRSQKKIEK